MRSGIQLPIFKRSRKGKKAAAAVDDDEDEEDGEEGENQESEAEEPGEVNAKMLKNLRHAQRSGLVFEATDGVQVPKAAAKKPAGKAAGGSKPVKPKAAVPKNAGGSKPKTVAAKKK